MASIISILLTVFAVAEILFLFPHSYFSRNFSVSEFIFYPPPRPFGFWGGGEFGHAFLYTGLFLNIVAVILLIFLLKRLGVKRYAKAGNTFAVFRKEAVIIFLAFVTFINIKQSEGYSKYLKANFFFYINKTAHQKRQEIFEYVYDFAYNCRKQIKGGCSAKLITDLDGDDADGLAAQRALAYNLYPIKIRGNDKADSPDCLVYYYKTGAAENVPDGYEIKYKMDDRDLLAVRKGFK